MIDEAEFPINEDHYNQLKEVTMAKKKKAKKKKTKKKTKKRKARK